MPASFLQHLMARDPRKLAEFPAPDFDRALSAWRQVVESIESAPVPAPAEPAGTAEIDGPIADLATHVWRARHRLNDQSQPADALRRTARHIDSAVETFRQIDLSLKDWINEPYDPGLPVKVLTFQSKPGLTRDTVIEAIRPAVLWRGRLLQSGEVVVGTPADAGAS